MADFRTANDVRNRTLTSQTIYANCIDATKIIGTITGGSSGVIIDSSTVVIINASELVEINASTVIVNSIQTCINASDEIKLICSGVILMTTNSLTMNIADLFDITTGQLAIDITGLGTINSSSLVVNVSDITVNASNDLNLISSGNLVISGSLTINNQLIDDEIVLLNASQVLTNKDLTDTTNDCRAVAIGTTGANVVISGTAPVAGQTLVASSPTAAAWTTPSFVGFKANLTTGGTLATGPNAGILLGATGAGGTYTEIYDIGGNFSTTQFTAPVTGYYHFDAIVEIEFSTLANPEAITVYLATSAVAPATTRDNATQKFATAAIVDSTITLNVNVDRFMNAAETVGVFVEIASNSMIVIGDLSTFNGHLLG